MYEIIIWTNNVEYVQHDESIITLAACHNNVTLVESLLDAGADMEEEDIVSACVLIPLMMCKLYNFLLVYYLFVVGRVHCNHESSSSRSHRCRCVTNKEGS